MADTQHPDASESKPAAVNADDIATERPQAWSSAHPSGRQGHGTGMQILRGFAFGIFFMTCLTTIFTTQLIGAPLYFINKDLFYAYMAMTKRHFGIVIPVITQIWGPTTIRISGDASVAGQIKPTKGGGVEFNFPERMVLIANHQIYTDWLYLWWVAYANSPGMHGHIYILLKESLKYVPMIGQGMMFYGFIYMSRKMATDRDRMSHRLQKLSVKKTDPTGKPYYDPMWLLLFPEGTNLSGNGRRKSANWAAKTGVKDAEHVLLPRSTGTFFCLNALKESVDYVYDCTVAYEGIPRGKYGEEIFGLNSTYFAGRPPKSVNLYWRRFRIADIPLDDQKEFEAWMMKEWYKKDELMEEYLTKGRFPAMVAPTEAQEKDSEAKTVGVTVDYIETQVRSKHPLEILQLFSVVGIVGLMWRNARKLVRTVSRQ